MSRQLTVLAVFLCLLCALSGSATARKWTDNTGKYSVEATFVGLKDGRVELKKPDGSVLFVPLARLSAADQSFVRKASGTAAPGDPREAEARVLAKMGNFPVADVSLPAPDPAGTDETLQVLRSIARAPKPLKDKIKACREHPKQLPATLRLEVGLAAKDIRETMGPYSSQSPGSYSLQLGAVATPRAVTWYKYGQLEVGVDEGIIMVVRVHAAKPDDAPGGQAP